MSANINTTVVLRVNDVNYTVSIVDGEFQEENSLVNLKFRGSTNQKKIDVQARLGFSPRTNDTKSAESLSSPPP